jgi:hypothetical protein
LKQTKLSKSRLTVKIGQSILSPPDELIDARRSFRQQTEQGCGVPSGCLARKNSPHLTLPTQPEEV